MPAMVMGWRVSGALRSPRLDRDDPIGRGSLFVRALAREEARLGCLDRDRHGDACRTHRERRAVKVAIRSGVFERDVADPVETFALAKGDLGGLDREGETRPAAEVIEREPS